MRALSPRLKLKQDGRLDTLAKWAENCEIDLFARIACGCAYAEFTTGGKKRRYCEDATHRDFKIEVEVRHARCRWPRVCECGMCGTLTTETERAFRNGDEAEANRLRAERLAHWLECRKERT
jgi:hypothetical protein